MRYVPGSSTKRTRLYNIYQCMKSRCSNPKNTHFMYYGGRSIQVCKEWIDSFELFEDWAINNGYQESLTLDRIDGGKDYEPNNCRWATRRLQANNRKTNVKLIIGNDLLSLSQISEKFSLPRGTIQKRYNKGLRGSKLISSKKYRYGEISYSRKRRTV